MKMGRTKQKQVHVAVVAQALTKLEEEEGRTTARHPKQSNTSICTASTGVKGQGQDSQDDGQELGQPQHVRILAARSGKENQGQPQHVRILAARSGKENQG